MGFGPFDPEFADVFFNGRKAQPRQTDTPKPRTITLDQLVERKTSVIRYGQKYYKIVVTEVERVGK